MKIEFDKAGLSRIFYETPRSSKIVTFRRPPMGAGT